jgi:hypothetical protein
LMVSRQSNAIWDSFSPVDYTQIAEATTPDSSILCRTPDSRFVD